MESFRPDFALYAIAAIVIVAIAFVALRRIFYKRSVTERFMSMAEAAGTIVYILDEKGGITYMNRRWVEVTGQPIHEALGEGWRKVLHPDDLRANVPIRAECMATKKPYRVKQRYRQTNGEYRWFISAATAVEIDAKFAWYGTATDIDSEHRALDEVEALYERERRVSKMLQTAFLPSYLPEVEGVGLQGAYRPAVHESQVGGDWYDVFMLRDGRVALSMGDVFGHGLVAATAMVRLRETLRAVTAFVDNDPSLVLQMANRAFAASHAEVIASAVFASYDPSTRILRVSSAGHPPPALLRNGNATFLQVGGVPLGAEADSTFTLQDIVLEDQDAVAFYTDGLTEVDHDPIEGERRFANLFAKHSGNPERLVDEMLQGRQRDDVALLILSIQDTAGRRSWHFKSDDASSAEDARTAFTAHLRRRNVDVEIVTAAELVFGELVGNVVRHSPGPIEVELLWRGDLPQIIVRDRGSCFQVDEIGLPRDDLADHGRGLYMVSRFASAPVVNMRTGGGNEVVVTLRRAAVVGAGV